MSYKITNNIFIGTLLLQLLKYNLNMSEKSYSSFSTRDSPWRQLYVILSSIVQWKWELWTRHF